MSNASEVTVSDNRIVRPYSLARADGANRLRSVINAHIDGITITDAPGPGIVADGVHQLGVKGNLLKDARRRPDIPAVGATDQKLTNSAPERHFPGRKVISTRSQAPS